MQGFLVHGEENCVPSQRNVAAVSVGRGGQMGNVLMPPILYKHLISTPSRLTLTYLTVIYYFCDLASYNLHGSLSII